MKDSMYRLKEVQAVKDMFADIRKAFMLNKRTINRKKTIPSNNERRLGERRKENG